MIPTFTEGILSATNPTLVKIPKDENMVFQFQYVLSLLRESEKPYINPKNFVKCMKNADNKPINVFEQMDADEFFNMFMDRLEFSLKGSNREKIIKEHFGGEFANQLICKDCPHFSNSVEPYLTVSL